MLNRISLFILIWLWCGFVLAQTDFGHKPGLNLVWHDEFDDSVTTAALWQDGFPWGRVICDVGYARSDGQNTAFRDGWLELSGQKEKYTGTVFAWDEQGNFTPYDKEFDYTAAMLYSKQSFVNGFFETRFRSDQDKGLFNSFWLYGENASEIDVFELRGTEPGNAQMTLHWKDKDPLTNSNQSYTYIKPAATFANNAHIFGTWWKPDGVTWYYNNIAVQENSWTRFIRSRHIPTVPLNIIVNSSIACLDEEPDSGTSLPGKIWFDYVRVYQNNDTVRAPEIDSAADLYYSNYQPTSFPMEILKVNDYYKTFPLGFRYQIEPGQHYTVEENKYRIEESYREPVYLNVRINDGINWSEIYPVRINPTEDVGMNKIPFTVEFSIQPNPSSGKFELRIPDYQSAIVKVYSIDGREVYRSAINSNRTILDLSYLKTGVYSVVVSSAEGLAGGKLLLIEL